MVVYLKLGGSLLTDKAQKERVFEDKIRRIAREIREGMGNEAMVIGHGGGSFGHYYASEYSLVEGLVSERQAIGTGYTRRSMLDLDRFVVSCFIEEGIKVFMLQPSSGAIAK
ncbi:MAG: hypothetical protein QXL16_01330, partial [Candidatus Micrarchaeaceae archaeon]